VEKIESGGKRWVYDLTVPDTHAFTANGYVVHNTELRLSKLSKMAFFNSYQLKALDLIPNFDGEEVEPVILHTNIPILLLLGATGIAVGSTCGIPSYSLRSVAKLTAMALQGKKITPAMCMSLEFENDWGGHIHPKHLEDGSLLEFYKTGSATLYFRCDYAIEGKNLVITGICPNLDPVKAITKTYDLDCVSHVQDESGMDDIRYVFTLKCKPAEMSEVVNDIVERIWTSFVVMRTNVTERQLTEQAKLSGSIGLDVTFSRMTVPDIINNWAKYRLQLEQTMAKLEIADLQSHNKRLTLTMLGITMEHAKTRALEVLKSVNLDHRQNNLPSELSGGEQQRVSIARAVTHKPKILFADEPTANLDSFSSRNVMDIFKKLNKEGGLTIVMVTHEEEYGKLADRIIKLSDGMVVG
jgi:ABC-type dipeptide/oligopeptide/nickel transport system ATPase subunit